MVQKVNKLNKGQTSTHLPSETTVNDNQQHDELNGQTSKDKRDKSPNNQKDKKNVKEESNKSEIGGGASHQQTAIENKDSKQELDKIENTKKDSNVLVNVKINEDPIKLTVTSPNTKPQENEDSNKKSTKDSKQETKEEITSESNQDIQKDEEALNEINTKVENTLDLSKENPPIITPKESESNFINIPDIFEQEYTGKDTPKIDTSKENEEEEEKTPEQPPQKEDDDGEQKKVVKINPDVEEITIPKNEVRKEELGDHELIEDDSFIDIHKNIKDIEKDAKTRLEAQKAYQRQHDEEKSSDEEKSKPEVQPTGIRGKLNDFWERIKQTKIYQILFPEKLNIVTGVLIPIILNIFGVILFLRLTFIVGEAGIWITMAMFTLSYSVVMLTALSISAIATNGKIEGGGAYYMISRTLGVEFGGAIGLIFYCANVCGGALYVIGFVETFMAVFPAISQWSTTYVVALIFGSVVLFLMGLIVLIGAQLYAKTALFTFSIISVAIFTTILSITIRQWVFPGTPSGFTGWSISTFTGNFPPQFSESTPFRKVFGILFPACTGFMAGANLSGDLSKPSRQIPTGTIAAVSFTYIIYISMSIIIAFTVTKETLKSNLTLLTDVNLWPPFVIVGIFASTVSAGLSSLISGSRILNALAKDALFPFMCLFKKTFGKAKEPRFGVIFTWLLVQCILFVGDLNLVAPFVTMFFLLAYMFTNLACVALSVTDAPNFRPTFKFFSKWTALLGTLLSIAVMFFVDEIYASVTFLIMIIVALFAHFYAPSKDWGDISRAIMYYQMRKYHLRNKKKQNSLKYWRFKGLALVRNPLSCFEQLRFINAISKHKGGFSLIGHITSYDSRNDLALNQKLRSHFVQLIRLAGWEFFEECFYAKSVREGTQNLFQLTGMGIMNFNTVLLGFYGDSDEQASLPAPPKKMSALKKYEEKQKCIDDLNSTIKTPKLTLDEYMEILKDSFVLKKGIVICRHFQKLAERKLRPKNLLKRLLRKKLGVIDIWLLFINEDNDEIENSISLILQLAYLVNTSDVWKKHHTIRVNILIDPNADSQERLKQVKRLLNKARLNATCRVIQLEQNDFFLANGRLPSELSDNDNNDLTRSISHEHSNGKRVFQPHSGTLDKLTKPIKKFSRSISQSRSDYQLNSKKLSSSISMDFLSRTASINDFTIDFPAIVSFVDYSGKSLSEEESYRVINSVILRETDLDETAVVFMTLPPPPSDFNGSSSHVYYQKIMKTLTKDLPPTMMVYSPENVISTFI